AANRSAAAFASASIAASLPASRWRWSSSCSAVSTTEVTIPGRQTTLPLVHRRRARVRGLASPGDPVALNAEGAEHDAERQAQRLQHRPLLDVQLEVGDRVLELRPRLGRAIEVDAVGGERVG